MTALAVSLASRRADGWVLRLALAVILVGCPAFLPATEHLHNLVVRSWLVEDGLPQNHVVAMVQTADGFLWVGTQEGLARFDGIEFQVLSVRSCSAFRHSRVYALAEDPLGVLWVGTAGGLVRLDGGKAEAITTVEGLSHDSVHALAVDGEERLWVGTRGGLDRVENGQVQSFGDLLGLEDPFVTALAADPRDGSLWVGSHSDGLLWLHGSEVRHYTVEDGLPAKQVNALVLDRQGRVWVATFSGLAVREGGRFRTFTEADGLSSRSCQGLYCDRDGAVWVGTTNAGLDRYRDGVFAVFSKEEGLAEASVASILRDREGNLWVGTLGGGLSRLQDYGLSLYTTHDGLSSNIVSAVLEDRAGRIWAGTWESGLNLLEGGRVTRFHVRDGLPEEAVEALLEDRNQQLWVGTRSGGVARYQGGRFVRLPLGAHADVRAIAEDRSGAVWVGTYGEGVFIWRRGAVERLGTAGGLSSDYVVTLYQDRTGAMLVGTDGAGVDRVVEGKVAPLAGDPELGSSYVRTICEDAGGTLWIGTSGNGLFRFRDGRLTSLRERDGLWSDKVFAIFERSGNLWLTCNRGVFRVSVAELESFADGRSRTVSCDVFGREPGLGNLECNGGYTPAGWAGSDGRLWFGTVQGLAALDPTRVELDQLPPRILVEELEVDRVSVPVSGEVRLGAKTQRVQIRYVGLSFTAPRSVTYRYRLEGLESGWVEAGARREVNYTHLRPGRYRFLVEARNGAGLYCVEPASVSFEILAPFWRTWWFLVAATLTATAVVYSLGKWRQVLAQRRERERMEVVRQLTVGILHELRQPMQVIQSRLDILRLRPTDLASGLEDVAAELGRLRDLLGQLEEVQHQRSLRTTSYARDDSMVDLSGDNHAGPKERKGR